jgi:hypothetical protein
MSINEMKKIPHFGKFKRKIAEPEEKSLPQAHI